MDTKKPENLPGLSARLLTDNCSREPYPCCFQGSGSKTPKFPFDFVPHNPSSVCFVLFLQCSSGPLSFMNNGFRPDEWPAIRQQGAPMATTEVLLCPLQAGGGWPGLGPASCPGMATGMLGPPGQGVEAEPFCFHNQPPGLRALSV